MKSYNLCRLLDTHQMEWFGPEAASETFKFLNLLEDILEDYKPIGGFYSLLKSIFKADIGRLEQRTGITL